MKITGAIFDADGTLFNSMFIWENIGSEYLLSQGINPRDDINTAFKGFSLYEAAEYYIKEYNVPYDNQSIQDGVNKMVENYYKNTVLPKDGVINMLDKFLGMGVSMCIATLTDRYLIEYALKHNKMEKYFKHIITCGEVGKGKDNPDVYREALSKIGTEKNTTYVFEDADYAIKTAKKDGFKVVGVYDNSFSKSESEITAICDIYIKDFNNFNYFD